MAVRSTDFAIQFQITADAQSRLSSWQIVNYSRQSLFGDLNAICSSHSKIKPRMAACSLTESLGGTFAEWIVLDREVPSLTPSWMAAAWQYVQWSPSFIWCWLLIGRSRWLTTCTWLSSNKLRKERITSEGDMFIHVRWKDSFFMNEMFPNDIIQP